MTKTYVRAVMDWVEGDLGDRLANQIILDLLIDDATGNCLGPMPAFGFCGSIDEPGSLYPFVLAKDGVIDYGACAVDAEREEHLNIREKVIVQGEYVTQTTGEGRYTYRIRKVTPLN